MALHQMTLVSAAHRLRIPWHKAHRLVLTGELTGRLMGRRWYVDVKDVERLATQQRSHGGGNSHLSGTAPKTA